MENRNINCEVINIQLRFKRVSKTCRTNTQQSILREKLMRFIPARLYFLAGSCSGFFRDMIMRIHSYLNFKNPYEKGNPMTTVKNLNS